MKNGSNPSISRVIRSIHEGHPTDSFAAIEPCAKKGVGRSLQGESKS